jgi:membrane protease subunit HflC
MQRVALVAVAIVLIAIAIVAYLTMFTVHQTQQALILRFGEPRRVITEPGLNWKIPFMDSANFLDKRILALDSPAQEVIASDQKRLVVDAYARYKITDALQFYQSVRSQLGAEAQLSTIFNSAVRRVLGDATFEDIVRDNRPDLMRLITAQVTNEAQKFGMTVIDVRIRRADLPEENSQAVYRRMQTEREREANDIRARGEEESQRIRARADREVRVIEAEARRESEVIRGEGDAERNRLYADAYGRDPEFFAFYRSMLAYEQGLAPNGTRLVISPDSEFFRYFKDPMGGGMATPRLPGPAEVGEGDGEDAAAEPDASEAGLTDSSAGGSPEPSPQPSEPVSPAGQ